MNLYRYNGVKRHGAREHGETAEDLSSFVESRFDKRWKSLRVTDLNGRLVGEIYRDDESNRRLWWAGTKAA